LRLVLSTGQPRDRRRSFGRRAFPVWVAVVLLAAGSGGVLGYFARFDLPDVRALEDYRPPLMTRVVAEDGVLLDTFAEQRRILIDYEDIPLVFQQALLASEDADFLNHAGIDFTGILRAAWRDLRSRRLAQGASTLTQQLARNLFLHRDKTFKRKLQETLLALEIERQYTKQEILGFYCNQVYMGHGRYGLEAASRYYFGVTAPELSLSEAATLAGLLQRPEALSPRRHPQRAHDRRNYVLRRMVEVGFLAPERAEAAQAEPLAAAERETPSNLAPFFVEEVRRWLQGRYGSSTLYTGGMTVHTTLDPRLQDVANRALELGLRELDKRQGWRGVDRRVPDDEPAASWEAPDWGHGIEIGRIYDAVAVEVADRTARLRLGPHVGLLGSAQIEWTGKARPRDLLRPGDIVRVRVVGFEDGGLVELALEQEPLVEGAIVVLEPSTGAVRALVGGFDFERSEYDRAMQSSRQTGSAFKPFVYAAALSSGWTLADVILDEPTVFLDPRNPTPYQPENYGEEYHGTLTLRTSLEKSVNISTVKLLGAIGYPPVIDLARRLGITTPLRPYASLALGAFETRLIELTAAYGAFANQGVLVEPHLIEQVVDLDGTVAERIEPRVTDAVSPQIAYLMNQVLAGVISDGTGQAAAALGPNLAGKTGTTDENTDAWFIGYSPDLAVGVWVGYDDPRPLGRRETGAIAALPIWRAFMHEVLAASGPPREFPLPPGIARLSVDRRTGLRADPRAYCRSVISEVFLAGTEPTASCSVFEHQRSRLPYPFQRYPLDERGDLVLDPGELESLLQSEPQSSLVDGARRLEVRLAHEVVSVPIRIVERPPAPSDPRLALFDTGEWVGTDGRRARVVWLDGG